MLIVLLDVGGLQASAPYTHTKLGGLPSQVAGRLGRLRFGHFSSAKRDLKNQLSRHSSATGLDCVKLQLVRPSLIFLREASLLREASRPPSKSNLSEVSCLQCLISQVKCKAILKRVSTPFLSVQAWSMERGCLRLLLRRESILIQTFLTWLTLMSYQLYAFSELSCRDSKPGINGNKIVIDHLSTLYYAPRLHSFRDLLFQPRKSSYRWLNTIFL